jgi:hypothetical protein
MKTCNRCGVELIVGDNWYECQKKCYNYICNQCTTIKTGKNRRKNVERYRGYVRAHAYRNGAKPMSENKTCSQFLGIHVAERVLAQMFNDVEVMPHGHPGYDFICNKGKKIDVKASCLNMSEHRWRYCIKRNTCADYFLCLAFDNRDDLNPLHIWLIPGDVINSYTHVSISTKVIDKWDDYKIPLYRLKEQCDAMRGSD